MIMVDTHLLAYLLLLTPHAAQADAVLLKDSDWIAPTLIHSEFRNVLLGAVHRQDVAADDARVLLNRATEVSLSQTTELMAGPCCPSIANSCGLPAICGYP